MSVVACLVEVSFYFYSRHWQEQMNAGGAGPSLDITVLHLQNGAITHLHLSVSIADNTYEERIKQFLRPTQQFRLESDFQVHTALCREVLLSLLWSSPSQLESSSNPQSSQPLSGQIERLSACPLRLHSWRHLLASF